MSWEHIELNIIPAGEMPVFHCSQYENSRPINITLMAGEDFYTPPEGTIIELHEHKVDDNIVIIEAEEIDGYRVVFIADEQVTACQGDNICELWLKDSSGNTIGTLNFIIHVEADPLALGNGSESVIKTIDALVEKSIAELAPDVVNEIARPIVINEAREVVGAIGGEWFMFSLYVENTTAVIYVPHALEGCIYDFYGSFPGLTIANVEELAFTDHSSTFRITYDNSNFPTSTVVCYLRYFNPASF